MRKIINNTIIYVLAMTFIFLFYVGCSPSWIPSDTKAIKLARDHYIYFSGKTIQATVSKRGEYIKKCACYPIQFNIILSNTRTINKTFYFYKNEAGNVVAKEFM